MTDSGLTDVGPAPLFVHLSDIHFDQSNVSNNGANVMARENLINDLREGRAELGPPAAVLVTGDIAFSGKEHQYDEAREFLQRVTDALGIAPQQVQVIPGNHDVDRSLVAGSVRTTHDVLRSLEPLDADNRLGEMYADASDPLFAPLAAYREFAVDYECDVSREYPFWETKWRIGERSVLRMRGLTTCIVSDGDDRRANLIVGTRQASVATAARDDVIMILGHHPTDWWHDMDECEDVMRDWVSLGLFGHKHVARISVVDDSIRLVAGAVHPERHSDWVPRYNWVRVGVKDEGGPNSELEVEIWSRVMLPSVNRFRSDLDEGGWNQHIKRVPLSRWAREHRIAERAAAPLEGAEDASFESADPPLAETTAEPTIVEQPPLAERPAVIAADGRPARIRIAIYEFGELPFGAQMKLLTQFDLFVEEDRHLPPTEMRMRAFARLRDSGRLEDFITALQQELEAQQSGPEYPGNTKEAGS